MPPARTSTTSVSSQVRNLAAVNNEFAFRMLAQLAAATPDRNVFFSPFSIAVALAMTYNGARGETQQAMARTLGLDALRPDEVDAGYQALFAALHSVDPQVVLAIANSLWGGQGEKFLPEFIERNRAAFDAEVATLDFTRPAEAAATINRWVEGKTNDKVRDLLVTKDLVDAILVLVNAIYFKGMWARPFDKKRTTEGEFHLPGRGRKRLPMMSQGGEFPYCETPELQGVALPFGGGRVSMVILLPKPKAPFTAFQAGLDSKAWSNLADAFDPMDGDLILPRFKAEYGARLKGPLIALGMGVAFDGSADFTGMCPAGAFISEVIHKAVLEVNEEGAEAAAATAVIMLRGMSFGERFRMVVDRPFFCAIRDTATGAILFMGYVVDPA